MNTKILLLLIFLFLYFSPNFLIAQNWFPLDVGNEWQYIQIEYSYDLHSPNDTTSFQVELVNDKILMDTTINNYIYYKRSLEPDVWYRYNNSDQKIYLWWDDNDRLVMDFTLPADSFFISYIPVQGEVGATVIEGNYSLFDSMFQYKGYEWFLIGDFYERNKFVNNYGLVDYYFDWSDGTNLFRLQIYSNLIQANIGIINYSSDVNPEIFLIPITTLSDSNFSLELDVHHIYNMLIPNPGYSYSGLNFIDSVYLQSFYSKDDSIIINSPLIAENIPNSEKWIINTTLDLNLLKDNFDFNYKIEAIDKGLKPHNSFAPDSGYFVAVYDTTTNINDERFIPKSAILSQNFPNPFNPSTIIKYEIPERSFVTLKVYDVLGNVIATLVNEENSAGNYNVEFNAKELSSGIYFYSLSLGNFFSTKKMILIK